MKSFFHVPKAESFFSLMTCVRAGLQIDSCISCFPCFSIFPCLLPVFHPKWVAVSRQCEEAYVDFLDGSGGVESLGHDHIHFISTGVVVFLAVTSLSIVYWSKLGAC